MNSNSDGGVRITSAEATENPTHAPWLQRDGYRHCKQMKTNNVLTRPSRSYRDLQQQIHDDLRIQHPDWVEPNGNCPTCDSYEVRLAELLGLGQRSSVVGIGKIIGGAEFAPRITQG